MLVALSATHPYRRLGSSMQALCQRATRQLGRDQLPPAFFGICLHLVLNLAQVDASVELVRENGLKSALLECTQLVIDLKPF